MLQMIGEDEWNQIQVAGPTFKTQMIVAGCFAVLWGSFFEVGTCDYKAKWTQIDYDDLINKAQKFAFSSPFCMKVHVCRTI